MKKTFAALVAVATVAGSLSARRRSASAASPRASLPASSAARSSVARSPPAARPMAGAGLCGRSALSGLPHGARALLGRLWLALPPLRGLQLSDRTARSFALESQTRPASAGFFFAECEPYRRRAHRLQHRFARPAIDLQAGRLLVSPERRARQHARLAVDLVLVEADARQVASASPRLGACAIASRPTTASRTAAGWSCGRRDGRRTARRDRRNCIP